MRAIINPILMMILCIGCMYVVLALAEKNDVNKSAGWPTVSGKLIDSGDGVRGGAIVRVATGASPLGLLQLLVTWPYAHYSYAVNGQRYDETKKALPCLSLVRMYVLRDKLGKDPEVTKVTTGEDVPIKYDPKTGEPIMPSLDEIMEQVAPPIKVRYDPTNPDNSMVDEDVLRMYDSLMGSGVALIVVGGIGLLLMRFHEFVTSPTPDPSIYSQSPPPRRRY